MVRRKMPGLQPSWFYPQNPRETYYKIMPGLARIRPSLYNQGPVLAHHGYYSDGVSYSRRCHPAVAEATTNAKHVSDISRLIRI